jgi:phenylalanyl-tRNA synthetase alpha chain
MPDIDRIRQEFHEELSRIGTDADLKRTRDKYLGRKGGVIATLMKSLASAAPEERRAIGQVANTLKTEIEQALAARETDMAAVRQPAGAVDVTLPGREYLLGHRHPLSIVRRQVETIFTRMGYQVLEGPEAEDDYHNFEALNMPPEHPARDMQDTLYLARPMVQSLAPAGRPATLLRTHTSAMQIRHMEAHQPPVRIIALGKVFRRDNLDLTHTPMFSQFEGLVVGEGVSMADLKGTITAFVREIFAPDTPVQFRPSFFPYTEPSAEVYIGCVFCAGRGCPVCKRTGWLEIMGSGMVHPAVFEAVGYDAERYTGFAFGTGIERVAMLKYRVDDIRLFYENDLRFLEQFPS